MAIEAAFLGMQGSMVPATFISRTVAEGETLAAGVPVAIDATERRQCKKSASQAGFLGFHCVVSTDDTKAEFESARIMTQGVIYIKSATDVVAGDLVGLNASGVIGKAAAITYRYVIAGAQFDDAATAGELVPVRMIGTQITDLGAT